MSKELVEDIRGRWAAGEIESAREQGRAEMRELMKCGHRRACWYEYVSRQPSCLIDEVAVTTEGYCSACFRERAAKVATIEACAKWCETQGYVAACADDTLAGFRREQEWQNIARHIRAINPDDIQVK